MRISKEEFLQIYEGLKICDYVDLFYTKPTNNAEIFNKFAKSKLWRLNNLYTVVNKQGERVKFVMNLAQHKVYAASLRHPRLVILKSRQQGISTFWLVSYFDDACHLPYKNIGLMAQGLDEAEGLLTKVDLLWDSLSPVYKAKLGLTQVINNTKIFGLSNKSKIFIRTSFRSATLQRLHVSEMGKIAAKTPERAKEVKTGTLQALAAGCTGVIESTGEGDNMFKELWDTAYSFTGERTPKDFLPIFLSWVNDPDCVVHQTQNISYSDEKYFKKVEEELGVILSPEQKNFWVTQKRELGEMVFQEYPSTPTEAFMATKDGTYYASMYFSNVKELQREVQNLYDPNLPVQVAFDLGMDDTMVAVAGQEFEDGTRIIDCFEDHGERIEYYVNWMKQQPWWSSLEHVILPHDSRVRSLDTGRTRYEVFEDLLPRHVRITVLSKTDVDSGIEEVRNILPKLWIDTKCELLIQMFYKYRKEWDEKLEKFKEKPLHDKWSNSADAFRYYVMGRTKWVRKVRASGGRVIGHDV